MEKKPTSDGIQKGYHGYQPAGDKQNGYQPAKSQGAEAPTPPSGGSNVTTPKK